MKTPDELYDLLPGIVAVYSRRTRRSIAPDDLAQSAYVALREWIAAQPPADRYRPDAALRRVRTVLAGEIRRAAQSLRVCSTDDAEAALTTGSLPKLYNAQQSTTVARNRRRVLQWFFNGVRSRLADHPTALEALQRLHAYDQDLKTTAAEMGLDVIEVDILVKKAARAVREELAERKWRVLRGDLTGILDEYEYRESPLYTGHATDHHPGLRTEE